jgi:hypothetical protein
LIAYNGSTIGAKPWRRGPPSGFNDKRGRTAERLNDWLPGKTPEVEISDVVVGWNKPRRFVEE